MTAGDLAPIEGKLSDIYTVVSSILSNTSSDVDLSGIQSILEDIQAAVSGMIHPILSTPLRDYTVTEGLLLCILLFLVLREIGRLVSQLWRRFFDG